MLTRFVGTLIVLFVFAVTFYLVARRRPPATCRGDCGCCEDFPRCGKESKFLSGRRP